MTGNGRKKSRMAIYVMAGFYLLWLAISIFKGLPNSQGGEKILLTVAMVLFILIGMAMVIFGTKTGYKITKRSKIQMEDLLQKRNKRK